MGVLLFYGQVMRNVGREVGDLGGQTFKADRSSILKHSIIDSNNSEAYIS